MLRVCHFSYCHLTTVLCLKITKGSKKGKTRAKEEKLYAVCESHVKERQQRIQISCQFFTHLINQRVAVVFPWRQEWEGIVVRCMRISKSPRFWCVFCEEHSGVGLMYLLRNCFSRKRIIQIIEEKVFSLV